MVMPPYHLLCLSEIPFHSAGSALCHLSVSFQDVCDQTQERMVLGNRRAWKITLANMCKILVRALAPPGLREFSRALGAARGEINAGKTNIVEDEGIHRPARQQHCTGKSHPAKNSLIHLPKRRLIPQQLKVSLNCSLCLCWIERNGGESRQAESC